MTIYQIDSINPGAKTKVKSSVQRSIRAKLIESYAPLLTPAIMDEMIPKKSQLELLKLFVSHLSLASFSLSSSFPYIIAITCFYDAWWLLCLI